MVSRNDLLYSCKLSYHTHTNKRLSCSLCFLQTAVLFCSNWTTILCFISRRRKFLKSNIFFVLSLSCVLFIYIKTICNKLVMQIYTTSFHFPIFTIPYVAEHITLSISYLILPYADEISIKRLVCDLLFTLACDNGLRKKIFGISFYIKNRINEIRGFIKWFLYC